jgi:PilZ domain
MSVRYTEMRRSPRIEVNGSAKLILIAGNLRVKDTIDCTVLNISEGGALIAAAKPIEETEFYLETTGVSRSLYLCAVVRRESQYRIGVRFI